MTDPVLTTGKSDHVHDVLSGYVNGDLVDDERQAVDSHLAECETCRADLSSLRLTVSALRQLPPTQRPRDFLIAPQPVRRLPAISHLRIWSGALAAVLALVVGARLLFPPTSVPPLASPTPLVSRASPPLPAAAPPDNQFATNPPVPAARQSSAAAPTPASAPSSKTGGASSVASSGAALSRTTSTATTVNRAPNPPAAPAPASPNSPEAYPAAPAGAAQVPSTVSYPAPAALPQASPSAEAYPAPATTVSPAQPVPSDATYPAPGATSMPNLSAAPAETTVLAQAHAPARETTWFTPALGILGALVLGAAIVLWILGRRSP